MTQGYLICTSVLLVWQLSRFDEYTSFSLLLALAFYDLCAVLSPCGPLKALVGLMQERNIPLPVNRQSRSRRFEAMPVCGVVNVSSRNTLTFLMLLMLHRDFYMRLIYQEKAALMEATEQVGLAALKVEVEVEAAVLGTTQGMRGIGC